MSATDGAGGSPPGDVLISGAGFAGLAAAWWMRRLGRRVVVVENAPALRRGGTPVDVEGEAIDALARMDLLDAARALALPPRRLLFKTEDDRTAAGVEPPPHLEGGGGRYEIHRDDLLDLLAAAAEAAGAELIFDRSISALEDGPDGVTVTFNTGERRLFALVLGCDGARSHTRRLAFGGAADRYLHFLGAFFAIKVTPETDFLPADTSEVFSTPGRAALLNGYGDRTDVALGFRGEREPGLHHRDRDGQRRLLHRHFDGLGWKTPRMLAAFDAGDDFYFDEVNQVRMPTWSHGRVALVGDAAHCATPFAGRGGSLALIGAARLADALAQHGDDHVAAFRAYHDGLRPLVEEAQEEARTVGMESMLPVDEAQIAARDLRFGPDGPGFGPSPAD